MYRSEPIPLEETTKRNYKKGLISKFIAEKGGNN